MRFATGLVCLLLVAVPVLTITWIKHEPGPLQVEKYDIHPILMTVAFMLSMGSSIIAYRVLPFGHDTQKKIHWGLHTIAFALATAGVVMIFKFHKEHNNPDMYSTHSYAGGVALGLFFLQYISGAVFYGLQLVGAKTRAMSIGWHRFVGIITFGATSLAIILGTFDRQRITWELGPASVGYFNATDRWANAIAMLSILAATGVAFVLHPVGNYNKQPEEIGSSRPLLFQS